ncbi:ATP-binding protein [Shewanella submarina]|uniref:histidine kinase n=1 Tax=Shewanella submarina TaxID=2016376 RepID=A0ABV7GE48_9GAMM|nr:ATP-binding protein [Shewanella submarina]MCL1037667.1 ATP-binding protein [Shewanella submarina]
MPLKMKKRLMARMFFTSLTIIALVGLGLAVLINVLHEQNAYNEETAELIAEIPSVAAELRESKQLPPNVDWLERNRLPKRYVMAACGPDFSQLWTSAKATELKLFDACEKFDEIRSDSPPYFIEPAGGKGYYAYLLAVELGGKKYSLLVMKDAAKIQQENREFSERTYWRLALVMGAAFILLASAGYWGLRPLVTMRNELLAINQGKSSELSADYPTELEGVSAALNQLLRQASDQQQRVEHSMNDLAHSLKTRLAAVHAITDDKSLSREEANDRIMAQIGQMDQLVKYQLKRATMGRKGLKQEAVLLTPMLSQITMMLDKVYREKQVKLTSCVSEDVMFPGGQEDLMELLGNLMENAYRLCISEVRVSAVSRDGQFELVVEDDGPGIEESLRDKVLQRGVRADSRSPGQGIGLAVCDEIVSSYQGTLTIENSVLEGALFRVRLPV